MKRRKTKARKAASWASAQGIREAWEAGIESLATAESEIEKQVRRLIKKNKLSAKDARTLLRGLGTQLAAQRKRAGKELDARLKTLQARVKKERKSLSRVVDDAVRSALAAFNIPSRREVADLTRRVEELSRKIDAFRRRPARRAASVKPAPAATAA
jgi:poly(hydroxyalkanoate) granule-associated protein